MNKQLLRASLCLLAIGSIQLQAANETGSSTASMTVSASSALTTQPLDFPDPGTTPGAMPTAGEEYWTNAASTWAYDSNNVGGYKVSVDEAEETTGVWQLDSGGNKLNFTLYINATLDGTANAFTPPTPTGGKHTTGTLGGTEILPGAAPNADSSRLYENTTSSSETPLVYAVIKDGELDTSTPVGTYTKTLNLTLAEL
ncbi:hypothetical protein COB21_00875 [Candidatus Aerophobetes bacterium]|uniref:WxL domain-containing protein n=1 Tax=Aerophobetes bacterium TaxID=2030807 RepID=A0A2A4X8N8_UNCAE|nr:MAG: hypothetical protein COB21_00875 [Candidatus Aerophobetes bacterium]